MPGLLFPTSTTGMHLDSELQKHLTSSSSHIIEKAYSDSIKTVRDILEEQHRLPSQANSSKATKLRPTQSDMSSTPKHEEQGEAQGSSDEPDASTRDQHPHEAETSSKPPNLTITNITGDLTVEPPDNAILIHSVNCLGVWGSGVALALAEALPGAYAAYQAICRQQSIDELLGSALLIPPQDGDYDLTPRADGSVPTKPRRWLYCLFVSKGYGRATKAKPGKSTRAVIIENTMKTLRTVRAMLYAQQRADEHWRDAGVSRGVIWACKFNSGSFGIAWETTLEIIKGIFERRDDRTWIGEMKVVSPA